MINFDTALKIKYEWGQRKSIIYIYILVHTNRTLPKIHVISTTRLTSKWRIN